MTGDKIRNIELSIYWFNQSLENFAGYNYGLLIVYVNLGDAYNLRIKGNPKENIETAIYFYNKALEIIDSKTLSRNKARIQMGLGMSYSKMIYESENIKKSIHHYEQAIAIASEAKDLQVLANAEHNIGILFLESHWEKTIENTEKAINYFNNALQVRTKDRYPDDYAQTKISLGNAYIALRKGDYQENVEIAIGHFNDALEIFTKEKSPFYWATIKMNLSEAYRRRTYGEESYKFDGIFENLLKSADLLKEILTVFTKSDYPEDWAKINFGLGATYAEFEYGDPIENLDDSIEYFKKVLEIFTEEDYPLKWAETQTKISGSNYQLAVIYQSLALFKGGEEECITDAFNCAKKALRIIKKSNHPMHWGAIQITLGHLYQINHVGEKSRNISMAIDSYQSALSVYTPKKNPSDCLLASRILGNIFLNQKEYQKAIEIYLIAIEAIEQIRSWMIIEERKQEIISKNATIYHNIVYCYAKIGMFDKSLEYVERIKARSLVDLMMNVNVQPKNIGKDIIEEYNLLYRKVVVEEKRLQQININKLNRYYSNGGRKTNLTISISGVHTVKNTNRLNYDFTRLNYLQEQLNKFIEENIKDEEFNLIRKAQPISWDKIKQTIPNKAVLIEWFISEKAFFVYIVQSQQQKPTYLSCTEEQCRNLADSLNNYYSLYLPNALEAKDNLPNLLSQLAQHLQLETIIEQIKQNIPDCNQLILVPHRWLHLLPIHALPLSDGKCFLDLFPKGVSYAPSVQLLQITQKQSKPSLTNLFSVQDPTEDLTYTNFEVEVIRSQFAPNDDVLVGKAAQREVLTKERLAKANSAHFSCHGYFNFENPELSALLMAGSKRAKKPEIDNTEQSRYLPSREGGFINLEKCLTLGEIFSLDLRNCRLVTLSACETGITDFRSLSDEYIGLPSGFLYAGSPSVVSSLWTVSDLSTTFLMIKFYQNLQEINSVPVALNQAQLWLRSVTKEELEEWIYALDFSEDQFFEIEAALIDYLSNACPFNSPYHWAAFCAVGS